MRGNSVIDKSIFSQEDFYVLDSLFLTDEAWFHLNGYITSLNSRVWSAENLRALHAYLLHSSNRIFSVQCLDNELQDHCFFMRLGEGRGGGILADVVIAHYS